MPSSRADSAVRAVNRCPCCAYPLQGLPGVPAEAYAPFTERVNCPECGLVIPLGARCVVGASTQGSVDPRPGGIWGDARMVILMVLVLGECLVLAWAFTRWGGGAISAFTPVLLSLPVLGIVLVVNLRRTAATGSLASDGSLGGADVRMLFEPGVLRIYSGTREGKVESCTGSDVHRVAATTRWRFFPKPSLPSIFLLRVQVPSSFKRAGPLGAVLCFVHAPPSKLPSDLARELTATLRASPGDGAIVPPIQAMPTPSVPPVCPACGKPLVDAAALDGEWRHPLADRVACFRCTFAASAGAYVVGGGARPSELIHPRKRRFILMVIVASLVGAGVFTMLVIMLARRSLSVLFGLQFVFVALAVGLPFVLRRFVSFPDAFRPSGRFQPSSVVWVVEPGSLTIVSRNRRWLRKRAVRQRIAAAGISRIEFMVGEPETNYAPGADVLVVRGTAPELGILGQRTVALSVYSGIDRDEFAAELTRTLKKRAAAAV